MRDYHDLAIWNRAMDFTAGVYRFTAGLPGAERFNLCSQLRRAATSVPLNIAEGSGAASDPEFARFVGYAYRSLKEVLSGLELCARLHPSSRTTALTTLVDEGTQLARMLHTFRARLTGANASESWQ